MTEEVQLIYEICSGEMGKSLSRLEAALIKIRAGKANPKMLDGIMVDYYGNPSPINQVANVKAMDARTLLVTPWEKPMLQAIEQSIGAANLGINPQNDGESVILSIPLLTEERRKDLAKQVKSEGENAKIGLRSARKAANDSIKKEKDNGLSEDQMKDAEGEIQKITDGFVKKVEALLEAKERDIMTI